MLKADRSMSNPNLESVEMRYQKALKEITKLIEANNLAR